MYFKKENKTSLYNKERRVNPKITLKETFNCYNNITMLHFAILQTLQIIDHRPRVIVFHI